MKVITIDFNSACVELAEKVKESYQPEVIVGIATGGLFVAQILSEQMNIPLVVVKKQRPMTKIKNKIHLDLVLKKIPYVVSNILRVLETKFNEYRFEKNKSNISYSDISVEWIEGSFTSLSSFNKILIVDDSIDSGKTLYLVKQFIKMNLGHKVEIKMAVLNQTFKNPLVNPDFLLDKNVIYRFPWSKDTKG
ncbi:phosphoribosyltransferase [Citrobacter portucalensis]|uniref:phosphoribosyltransferase n=1 Tax=Citrobacter portucalensis TaxID=1639133 RepID=UPI002B22778A|nr:phosphoribosyltransferase family protein [Citrobacter portucalensis]MEB0773484.1 phosphoribosyltransferase family protein [Citrobacter portucalensis]MEB0840277.1 phosphoribosyltransferase family protein [Citrobacter portucalensis]